MMRILRRTWWRLLGSLPFRAAERELAEELESHLAMLADDNVRRGMTREEAERRARLKFGNIEVMKEQYRDQRSLALIETTLQDLRYAVRVLRRSRGFTTVAILSLAIGIGANTAIFSLVNGVLLQPLPYHDPDRLFGARTTAPLGGSFPINPAQARAWAAASPSLEGVAVLQPSRAQIAAGTEPVLLQGARVTHNFFSVLGVEPMLGRTFLPEEDAPGGATVAILTETLWRARFNADPTWIGRTAVIDGIDTTVVGVVRGTFWRSMAGGRQVSASNIRFEVFRPLALGAEESQRITGNYNYAALVRVKPGVAVEQALAEINVVQARVPRPPESSGPLQAHVIPLHEIITGRSTGLWLLAGAVGAVLLMVCMNLANLSLSRVTARRREAAVRSALGASRARQFRQALTESLVLAVAGGALGVLLAAWLVQLLVTAAPIDLPRIDQLRLDPIVLGFALVITIVTGLLFGVLPALRLTGDNPNQALRSGSQAVTEGRGALRLREGLVGLEVGVCAALLIVAALLTTSLDRLLSVDKGFDVDRILTFNLDTAGPLYEDAEYRDRFFTRVLNKLAAIPGVEAAGLTIQLPLEGNTWNDSIYHVEQGGRSERHPVDNRYASPGYFAAMNIAPIHGRVFDESDRGRHVALLSVKAARILWPDDPNPVGRQFMGEDDRVKTLVGIVGDVRASLHDEPPPHAYYPYWQRVPGDVDVVVRTALGPRAVAGAIRAALQSEDRNLPIAPVRDMQALVDGVVEQRRFQSTLVIVFAVSALLVASLGIYGVVSYSVARRRNEMGIRMALGARRSQLLRSIVTEGMLPVMIGVVSGVVTASLVSRAIRSLLFEVDAADPRTIGMVTLLLLVVGAVACVMPARRATGPNTIAALRFE
jgi:putative ABC transport system permease protein